MVVRYLIISKYLDISMFASEKNELFLQVQLMKTNDAYPENRNDYNSLIPV